MFGYDPEKVEQLMAKFNEVWEDREKIKAERDKAIAERDKAVKDAKELKVELRERSRKWADFEGTDAAKWKKDADRNRVLFDKAIAERDDYRDALQAQAAEIARLRQVLSDYKSSQNGIMMEMYIKTALRAIKVCEERRKTWLKEESKWGERDFLSVGAETIIDALRAEFGLDKGE
jgi:hypothetical protein